MQDGKSEEDVKIYMFEVFASWYFWDTKEIAKREVSCEGLILYMLQARNQTH